MLVNHWILINFVNYFIILSTARVKKRNARETLQYAYFGWQKKMVREENIMKLWYWMGVWKSYKFKGWLEYKKIRKDAKQSKKIEAIETKQIKFAYVPNFAWITRIFYVKNLSPFLWAKHAQANYLHSFKLYPFHLFLSPPSNLTPYSRKQIKFVHSPKPPIPRKLVNWKLELLGVGL